MKKNILILACLATVFVGCQKDDNLPVSSTNDNASKETITTTNASKTSYLIKGFTKKVLVEEFVGTTYGDAPEFSAMLNSVINSNSNMIIKALHHNNDILESPQTDALVSYMSPNGYMAYPTSLIDRESVNGARFIGSSNTQSVLTQQLNKPANCGISISSMIYGTNKVHVEVEEKFIPSSNNMCNVTVYLVENNVILSGANNMQANNFNNTSKSIFYQMGNPLMTYAHENVVRKCITPPMGVKIKSSVITSGGMDHQKFDFEIPSYYNTNNCYIIAFVSKCMNNTSVDIENVQIAKLGTAISMN